LPLFCQLDVIIAAPSAAPICCLSDFAPDVAARYAHDETQIRVSVADAMRCVDARAMPRDACATPRARCLLPLPRDGDVDFLLICCRICLLVRDAAL